MDQDQSMHDRDEYVLGKVHISNEVLMKYHMYTPNFGAIKALNICSQCFTYCNRSF